MEPRDILDTMLGYLGFVAEIQEVETENGRQLQVFTAESDAFEPLGKPAMARDYVRNLRRN